jgi:DHA1 family tetracycline resistance protein-like MFS transporter
VKRDLLFIFAAMATWGIGEGMFLYFQPLYLQQLGADPLQIGAILGLVGLVMSLAFLPAGHLSDRLGRRPLLLLSWILGLLSTILMAIAPSLPWFIIGMVLYGSTSFVTVPLYSYVTAARGNLSVGRAVTLNSACFNLGYIVGPLLGGTIGERLGLHANFRIAAIIFAISTMIILFIRSQPVEPSTEQTPNSSLKSLWDSRFGQYVVLVFAITFGLYLPQPLSQNFLQNERGLSLVVIGQLISIRGLGTVILNLALGQLDPRRGLILAQAGMGIFAILIWLGTGLPFYFAGYLLLGSYVTVRNLAIAQGRDLVQAANMGMAYGMLETAGAIAIVFSPILAGWIYKINPNSIYFVGLGLILAGIAANLLFSSFYQTKLVLYEESKKAQL